MYETPVTPDDERRETDARERHRLYGAGSFGGAPGDVGWLAQDASWALAKIDKLRADRQATEALHEAQVLRAVAAEAREADLVSRLAALTEPTEEVVERVRLALVPLLYSKEVEGKTYGRHSPMAETIREFSTAVARAALAAVRGSK